MKFSINISHVFVAHVRQGYEARARHMETMLSGLGIPFEWMLDGDISDLEPATLARYFRGDEMVGPFPQTSCSLKHLLIYKRMVDEHLTEALVFEDDILLGRRFVPLFNRSLDELHAMDAGRAIMANYEDTRLRFVPRSQRRHGQLLYKGDRDRMAGAYYINLAAARALLASAESEKFDAPIDLMHRRLLERGEIDYYWCQPTIATQGSHNGLFASGITLGKGMLLPMKWRIERLYKQALYFFR